MFGVTPYIDSIKSLCKDNHVKELFIFGSALNESFTPSSDIDLLVDFHKMPPREYTSNYFKLKFSLEEIFGRPVDLLEKKELRNPYFIRDIDAKKRLIYAS
jgi:predicted nucleotidyltransferase